MPTGARGDDYWFVTKVIDMQPRAVQMPDKDGLEYLRLLSEIGFSNHSLLISGYDDRVLKTRGSSKSCAGSAAGVAQGYLIAMPLGAEDVLRLTSTPAQRKAARR